MSQHPLRRRDLHSFQVTSNGLASGNTLLEAINAGLFEVIERDAVACNLLAQRQLGRTPPIVDPATVRAPLVLELIDRLRHAGAEMVLFDCTIDTAVPTYMANIRDRRLPALGVCVGYGAHLDTEVAMVRAITEAVQSRAVRIAGSRDDTFRHHFLALPAATAADRAPAARCAVTVDAGARRSEAGPTFEGDTQAVLRKLRSAGLRRAIVVDLSLPELPIRVVKVIVPGLEGSLHHFYEPGRRARAFLAKEAVA